MRFEIRESAAWLREQLDRVCLWHWEIVRLRRRDGYPFDILYMGRKAHRVELAKVLTVREDSVDTRQANAKPSSRTVLVSEIPIPGALCVPQFLTAVVPLGRSIEEVMAEYEYKLRRNISRQRTLYRRQQVMKEDEIDRAHREMLYPFANARHGSAAIQKSSDYVQKSALGYGRLDFLLAGDEVVGCMLGNESIRAGRRYWVADRCGYPEAVFSDPKRLAETNSINIHMALEWAIENGFDYCDLGRCFASPDDGLLQFKRRRGAELDSIGLRGLGYFHIRLPKLGTAKFLWDTPLFAVEHQRLTLHLGLPAGTTDDEFIARHRQMGFGGLFKVYLHSTRPLGEDLLATLGHLYKHQKSPPLLKSITSM